MGVKSFAKKAYLLTWVLKSKSVAKINDKTPFPHFSFPIISRKLTFLANNIHLFGCLSWHVDKFDEPNSQIINLLSSDRLGPLSDSGWEISDGN